MTDAWWEVTARRPITTLIDPSSTPGINQTAAATPSFNTSAVSDCACSDGASSANSLREDMTLSGALVFRRRLCLGTGMPTTRQLPDLLVGPRRATG